MAKNKFASMLHRNTNKITVVLVYAVIEWILILLLFLNSLFSYLIIKYAEFFGVERPCPWCTVNMHTDLVCEAHANQISKLGYCSNHRKLGDSEEMCLRCLQPEKRSMFPWMMGFGVIQDQKEKVGEKGELSLKCCCCCGVELDHFNTAMFSSVLFQASPWLDDVLERIQKQDWITCSNHIQEGDSSVSISDGEMKELEAGAGEDEDGILQLEEKFGSLEEKESSISFLHYNDRDRVEEAVVDFDINVEPKLSQEEENSLVFVGDEFQEMAAAASASGENEADVSLGKGSPDIDQESVHSYKCNHNSPSTSSPNLDDADDHGAVEVKEKIVEFQSLSLIHEREHMLKIHPPFWLELNEIEVDEVLTRSASVDRNLAFLEKRDSVDEGVDIIESLKSALRAERKTSQDLYAELEEERSASAEAVNQAMAMINRLQEEKAAMQMEAFQYQRMMEEQSEYDQEALQLMHELVIKLDKEKQDLEMELEVYRNKLLHYETSEEMGSFQHSC